MNLQFSETNITYNTQESQETLLGSVQLQAASPASTISKEAVLFIERQPPDFTKGEITREHLNDIEQILNFTTDHKTQHYKSKSK